MKSSGQVIRIKENRIIVPYKYKPKPIALIVLLIGLAGYFYIFTGMMHKEFLYIIGFWESMNINQWVGNMESKHLLFVYGTLRSGHCNHHLLKNANSYGVGETVNTYAMYLTSGYPYVTSCEQRYPIVGELYGIDDSTLSVLDKMEGHPRHYERREILVTVERNQYTAWMYFKDPPGVLMQNGDYSQMPYGKA